MPEAAAPSDDQLPVYTVLVPLFREARVVRELLAALRVLDYPAARLEVMLIVEAVDRETEEALRGALLPPHMQVLVVPDGEPRTKPRAIQYALQFAEGEYVVVYDAEDTPEPDQLRRALMALKRGGPRMGCLQAQLNIYNSHASWFTRQFTIEYTVLFDCILPALERLQLPVPLGGTSNHFPARRARRRRRLGPLQRDGGRRSRHPARALRLARRRSAVNDVGGGAADLPRLEGTADAMAQGLDADLPCPYAPPAAALV